ncbi:MAG: 30S ribosome-binding factor RbfA [Deltaproteobacteria bacterium]|nr:30S ribosome-binding factor RbfA [Deltaproteobacteria bacterium]
MESNRANRVAHLIKKEVAEMLAREVKDPRIGMATITDVVVSKDLRYAHIYYSRLGTEKEVRDAGVGLKRATKFIQGQLGRRLALRFTPIIEFRFDKSLEYGNRIDKILHEISEAEGRASEPEIK